MSTRQLGELAKLIDAHPDWWRFPEDGPIRGFLGSDPIFLVGDQPSTSAWESWHPNRRAFYGLLEKLGASNAHLTDLYKRRGRSGALRSGLPADFDLHLRLFREELAILRPTRVVALGGHAYDLLATHVPEVRPILSQMWHFAYAVRYGRLAEWEENARAALEGRVIATPAALPTAIGVTRAERRDRPPLIGNTRPPQRGSQRAIMQRLFLEHGGDVDRVIAAYAEAERRGEADRSRNTASLSPEEYARALLRDGIRKGWLG